MRIVIGPHAVVLTPPFETMPRHGVSEERPIDLTVEIFAGVFRNRRRIHTLESVVVVIPLLQHKRHPTDLVLHTDESKLRVALQNSVKDKLKKSIRNLLELEVNAASVVLDPRPLLTEHGFLVVAMPGKDMQVDGHVQILGRRPELIVMLRVKRQVRMRRLPDDQALQAGFGAALELFYRLINVVNRDSGNTDQALGRHLAILDQPIVVCPEAGLLQFSIIHGEVRQQIGGVEHFCAETIGFHLFDSARWIRAAGMGLKTFSDFEHRKNRSLVSQCRRNPLLQSVGWLHHVRV